MQVEKNRQIFIKALIYIRGGKLNNSVKRSERKDVGITFKDSSKSIFTENCSWMIHAR